MELMIDWFYVFDNNTAISRWSFFNGGGWDSWVKTEFPGKLNHNSVNVYQRKIHDIGNH